MGPLAALRAPTQGGLPPRHFLWVTSPLPFADLRSLESRFPARMPVNKRLDKEAVVRLRNGVSPAVTKNNNLTFSF